MALAPGQHQHTLLQWVGKSSGRSSSRTAHRLFLGTPSRTPQHQQPLPSTQPEPMLWAGGRSWLWPPPRASPVLDHAPLGSCSPMEQTPGGEKGTRAGVDFPDRLISARWLGQLPTKAQHQRVGICQVEEGLTTAEELPENLAPASALRRAQSTDRQDSTGQAEPTQAELPGDSAMKHQVNVERSQPHGLRSAGRLHARPAGELPNSQDREPLAAARGLAS